MFSLLLLLLLVVPFVELWVIVEVWRAIGGPETLLVLVTISVLGAWMVKREGLGVWTRLNAQLAQGQAPTDALLDGALVLVAGALLLTPGFVTDAVGFLLLFPPSRAGLRALARRQVRRRVEGGGGAFRVVSARVVTGSGGGAWGPTSGPDGPRHGADYLDVASTLVDGPTPTGRGGPEAGRLGPGEARR